MREWDLRRIGDSLIQFMEKAWTEPWHYMRVLCSTCARAVEDVIFYGVSGLTSRSLPRSQRRSVSRSHVSRRTTSPVVSHHVDWLVWCSLLCSTTKRPLQLCVLVILLASLSPSGYGVLHAGTATWSLRGLGADVVVMMRIKWRWWW